MTAAGGITETVKTTFNVTRPVIPTKSAAIGTADFDPDKKYIGLFNAPGAPKYQNGKAPINNVNIGAYFTADVQLPNGFGGVGVWKYVQLVNSTSHFTILDTQNNNNKIGFHDKLDGTLALDSHDPYSSLWNAGTGIHPMNDTPNANLIIDDKTNKLVEAKTGGQFETFVMFQAPSPGSQWVAVLQVNWSFNIAANNNDGKGVWNYTQGAPRGQSNNPQPTFQYPSKIPLWPDVARDDDLVPD